MKSQYIIPCTGLLVPTSSISIFFFLFFHSSRIFKWDHGHPANYYITYPSLVLDQGLANWMCSEVTVPPLVVPLKREIRLPCPLFSTLLLGVQSSNGEQS